MSCTTGEDPERCGPRGVGGPNPQKVGARRMGVPERWGPPRAQMCAFQGPGFRKTPPKFHERTPRERRKNENCCGRGKKSENLGRPAAGGPPEGRGPADGGSGRRGSTERRRQRGKGLRWGASDGRAGFEGRLGCFGGEEEASNGEEGASKGGRALRKGMC